MSGYDAFDMNARVIELEKWRISLNGDVKHLRDTVEKKLVPAVEELVTEDKISRAIGDAMQSQESRGWTKKERLILVIGGVTAVLSATASIVNLFHP